MREFKPVNRGLYDAMDPAFSPDGSLKKAVNSRYRPGSTTLWQAEGRSMAGSAGGISQIAGLAWDPPLKPELIYWDGAEYQLWPAAISPIDDGFQTSTDLTNIATNAHNGTSPWEVVSVPGGFFLFDGTKPKFITNYLKSLPPPAIQRVLTKNLSNAGIPALGPKYTDTGALVYEDLGTISALRRAGTCSLSPNAGYWYWAVLASNSVSHSSRQYGGPLVGGIRYSVDSMPYGIVSGTSSANGDIRVTITLGTDIYADPKWDYVYVYRNKDGTVVNSYGVAAPAYPNGICVRKIPKSSFTYFAPSAGYRYYTYVFDESTSTVAGDGHVFDYVTASVDGRSAGDAKNGELPRRVTCGDVYQDCLMINDLDNPRMVRYSYPGQYQSFPNSLFFLTMNSTDADAVTAIKNLGQVAIVLTSTTCWRVSSLPTSSDFDFSHGEVQTILAESTGTSRSQAVTKAHLPQPYGTVCCWVSGRGIFATNGFDVIELTSHIDWKKINVKLDKCNLVDDPMEHRLVFHDGNSNLYYLHYHPAHVTDGVLAITGPITRPGGVSHLFRFYTEGGLPQVASLDATGHLLYEGLNNMDESTGTTVLMDAETKEYYPGGIGAVGSVPKVMAHVAAIPTLNGTYIIGAEQGPDADHLEYTALEQVTRQLFVSSKNMFTETLTFKMAGSGSQDFGINAVGWDWDDHGTT